MGKIKVNEIEKHDATEVTVNSNVVMAAGTSVSSPSISTDTISEKTSASGVTIDGVLVKDGAIASSYISGLSSGKVLQVVTAESTTNNTINTTTLSDCGLSASITPSSSSNKILVLATQFIYHQEDASVSSAKLALLRDTTVITGDTLHQAYLNVGTGSISQFMFQYPFMVLDSPSTTSAITYKTQGRLENTANNSFMQTGYSSAKSHMTLIEIDGT